MSRPRGFAAMDPEKQRQIASLGGKIAHEKGVAHEFDSHEAAAAGTKGGISVSADRAHMAEIGAMGGRAGRGKSKSNRNASVGGD